jgi:hypothetical protein
MISNLSWTQKINRILFAHAAAAALVVGLASCERGEDVSHRDQNKESAPVDPGSSVDATNTSSEVGKSSVSGTTGTSGTSSAGADPTYGGAGTTEGTISPNKPGEKSTPAPSK